MIKINILIKTYETYVNIYIRNKMKENKKRKNI